MKVKFHYVRIACLVEHVAGTIDSPCRTDEVNNRVDPSLAGIQDPLLDDLVIYCQT